MRSTPDGVPDPIESTDQPIPHPASYLRRELTEGSEEGEQKARIIKKIFEG